MELNPTTTATAANPKPPPAAATPAYAGEKSWRSLAKSLSYRTTGTGYTVALAYLFTGHAGQAVSIGAVEFCTKTILYYLHERAWERIHLGRVRAPAADYQI
ncbi:MAG: DUF2061 domain-containing protein [Lentisphaeria bacterium]|jgi:uncharacterized membrane protein